MTDWKALAAARCTDIPPDAAARIAPSLEALENAFRPLTEQLTPEIEPAVTFTAVVADVRDMGRDAQPGGGGAGGGGTGSAAGAAGVGLAGSAAGVRNVAEHRSCRDCEQSLPELYIIRAPKRSPCTNR